MRKSSGLLLRWTATLPVVLVLGYGLMTARATASTQALAPAGVWPTWTPRPTATRRVYPSWTPQPTATSRRTATPTRTATPNGPDLEATSLPSRTPRPCLDPWVFTTAELWRVQAAALLAGPVERDLIPAYDMLCGIGLYQRDLGMPTTESFAVEGDEDGSKILCRGFCMGIVAVMQVDGLDETCEAWNVVSWGGEQVK